MFNKNEIKKVTEQQYPSAIKFYLDDGNETRLPRSTNIKQIRWAGSDHPHALFVEFYGWKTKEETSGYIYQTSSYSLWQELVMGAEVEGRTSTGVVFHSKVKAAKIPFEKVW